MENEILLKNIDEKLVKLNLKEEEETIFLIEEILLTDETFVIDEMFVTRMMIISVILVKIMIKKTVIM